MSDGSKPRACIFCGASPLTKTHLIARKSIRQYLPQQGHKVDKRDAWIDDAGDFNSSSRAYNLDPLEQYVKRACEPCNRDWMGAIEIEVAPLVIALARGQRVDIESHQAARLALWASIVAVLRSTQDPGAPAVQPSEARYMREHSAPPADYVVWLIRGESRWDFPTRHQRMYVLDRAGQPGPAHVTWFWIGESIYLVAPSVLSSRLGVLELIRPAISILHPYGDYPISWPLRGEVLRPTMIEITSMAALR